MSDITSLQTPPRDLTWSDHDLERFHRLYALRCHLESFMVREAAARAVQGRSLEALEIRCRQMSDAAARRDYARFLDADMAFHQAVAELADVPGLVEIWRVIAKQGHEFVEWAHQSVFRDLMMISQNHVRLLEAIRNGNGQDAEREAQTGLDSLWQTISEEPVVSGTEGDRVGRVCGYIMYNLAQPLSLTQVAREVAHLSAGHLAKLFREARGECFRAHVQRLRLNRAAALLRETDLPVQIVAARVGYSDCSRFAGYFAKRFGCTPTQWREKESETAY